MIGELLCSDLPESSQPCAESDKPFTFIHRGFVDRAFSGVGSFTQVSRIHAAPALAVA
jgi:hypothetical protein